MRRRKRSDRDSEVRARTDRRAEAARRMIGRRDRAQNEAAKLWAQMRNLRKKSKIQGKRKVEKRRNNADSEGRELCQNIQADLELPSIDQSPSKRSR